MRGIFCRKRASESIASRLRILKYGHFHRHSCPVNLVFEIDPDLWIFVFVFDERAAFAQTRAHAFLVDGFPDTEEIFPGLAAVAESELARLLSSGVEVLMKPTCRRAKHTSFAPVHSNH